MLKLQPTVIIGVGPSGKAFLEYFKQRVTETYEELPAIKLLAIDAIFPNMAQTGGAGNDHPQVLGPSELLELDVMEDIPESVSTARARFRWLPEQIETMDAAGREWNETRPAVRAAFHNNYTSILRSMEFHFQRLADVSIRDVMEKKGFDISSNRAEFSLIIVGSVGEVAGSALLLDATYMSVNIFRRAGIQVASTGILFVPPVVPSDPMAEAISYAALKEINYAIETQKNPVTLPGINTPLKEPLFNRGCFIIDKSNENNLSLKSQDEVIKLSAEWLFRMMLSPLKGRIDDFISDKYIFRNQNRTTAYGALGLAMYVLPCEELIEWGANRLGHEILMNSVLASKLFSEVSTRLTDFYINTQLRPDALKEKLGVGRDRGALRKDPEVIGRINSLTRVEFDQLPALCSNISRAMREKELPTFSERIQKNAKTTQQEMNIIIQQESQKILNFWPRGGLSLAMQFLQRLQQDNDRFSSELERRAEITRAKNDVQSQKMQKNANELQNVVACKPSVIQWICTSLGILSFAGLFTAWLIQNQGLFGFALTLVLIALIWISFIGGGVYSYHNNIADVEEVRDKCIGQLEQQFQGEVDLKVIQAALQLYPEVRQIAKEQMDCIRDLQSQISSVAAAFKQRLDTDPLCGEIGFQLQTSVLTPDLIEDIYITAVGTGGSEPHLKNLIDEVGSIDSWSAVRPEDLENRIIKYCTKSLNNIYELRVEKLLSAICETKIKRELKVAELYDKAAPLMLFDTFLLGTETASSLQTYVGIEKEDSEFYRYFIDNDPTTIMEVTGDGHSLLVTSIRSALPLFSLRRITEFRDHYLEYVQENMIPLHIEDEVALAPDLLSKEQNDFNCSLLFAVGLALGLVRQRQDDKHYGVFSCDGQRLAVLTQSKINSAILIGANDSLFASLSENIQTIVSQRGNSETASALMSYQERGPITAWERKQIEKYIELLQR